MKSIRRSLIINVLILLVLTLGAVFGLAYQMVERALEDRKQAAEELLNSRFDEQIDEALRQQAWHVASIAHLQSSLQRPKELDFVPLGLLTALPSPHGHLQLPMYFLAGGKMGGWPTTWLNAVAATKIEPTEELLAADPEAKNHEMMQINGQWGRVWHYPRGDAFRLPFEPRDLVSNQAISERFDEMHLSKVNQRLRRITIKVPLQRFRTLYQNMPISHAKAMLAGGPAFPRDLNERPMGPGPRGPRGNSGPPGPPPGSGVVMVAGSSRSVDDSASEGLIRESSVPNVLVQVAWNLDSGHPRVIEFQKNRQEQIDKLEAEMQSGLSKLRSNFVIIAAVAMSLLIVGGWVFVSLTMKPLQHLSSAVSQISPKDFQLPIEVKSLPKEVRPVSERLKDALFELKKVFEREKRAAADISHELRTPLAALTTTLDVTLRKPRTDEEYREVLRDCRDIAGQMSHLVERLLLLAWIDAGADRLQMQDVEVSKLISECTTVGKPLAEAQGLRFRVMLPEELTVRTDRDKLREVLMNLVHNAIEYNRPGGEIEVSASSNGTAGIVFEVRDTGIGIAREMQDKIFERFYRGDPSRNAAGVHAGLGLAIVKEYIDRLGGTLLLDSTVGQGSRFRIELPLG